MIYFINFVEVGVAVVGIEWLSGLLLIKSGLAFKLLPKSKKTDYSIGISNNGWDIHLPSQNPLDFINLIFNKISGDDATTEQFIQQNIKNVIKSKSKLLITKTLENSEVVNKKISQMVLENLESEILNKKK